MIVDDRSEIIREEVVVAYYSAPNMTAFREMRRRNNVSDRQDSQPVAGLHSRELQGTGLSRLAEL
jgi:hypothetical protein